MKKLLYSECIFLMYICVLVCQYYQTLMVLCSVWGLDTRIRLSRHGFRHSGGGVLRHISTLLAITEWGLGVCRWFMTSCALVRLFGAGMSLSCGGITNHPQMAKKRTAHISLPTDHFPVTQLSLTQQLIVKKSSLSFFLSFLDYNLIKRNPPLGGVSYLLCSLIKNPEEEDPPWRTTPTIDQFCGWFFMGGPLPPGSWFGFCFILVLNPRR